MKRLVVPIKGMHCRSCEMLVEKRLREVKGVKRAKASYRKSAAEISVVEGVKTGALYKAIIDAGYEIGREARPWINKNPADYRDLTVASLALVFLILLFEQLGLADLGSTSSGSPSSLLVVLVVGLTAGISTCMALVGGLVLGISARHAEKHPEATAIQKFRPHLFFIIGRIVSYFLLGGLIGMVGSVFQLSTPALGWLTILVGIVMFMLGLQLTGIFPRLSNGGLTLPKGLSRVLGIQDQQEKEYSNKNAIIMGALTFFLPCGFTQAMQLYAMSTGNFASGALIMGVFAVGTAPGLLSIGGITSFIKGAFAQRFFKFAGLAVMFLAVFNMSNGFNLTGLDFDLGGKANAASVVPAARQASASQPAAGIEDGAQVVRMNASGRGYSPNQFTVQKGIPVKWIITAANSRSCADYLVSARLNIRQVLNPGENVITFTPTETGSIRFSCSMGMYTGNFNVIERQPDGASAKG